MEDGMISVRRRAFAHVGMAMFVMTIVSVVLQFVAVGVAEYFWPGSLENSWLQYAALLVPQYLIAMPIAVLIIWHMPHPQIEKKRLLPKQFLVIFLICYFIMYAGSIVGTVVTSLIGVFVNGEMTDFLSELLIGSDIWATIAASAILAPIAEEIFYRKLVIDRLGAYGEKAAVVASALIFGLAHGNLSQFFYAFGLGLALGYVYINTRRITYTIALHMIVNLIGGVLAPLALDRGSDGVMALFSFVIFGLMVTGLVLLVKNRRNISFAHEQDLLPRPKWASAAFLNAGMILFFAVSAMLFVLSTVTAFE